MPNTQKSPCELAAYKILLKSFPEPEKIDWIREWVIFDCAHHINPEEICRSINRKLLMDEIKEALKTARFEFDYPTIKIVLGKLGNGKTVIDVIKDMDSERSKKIAAELNIKKIRESAFPKTGRSVDDKSKPG